MTQELSGHFVTGALVTAIWSLIFLFFFQGETVRTVPSLTFFPKTVAQIQAIVRYAREKKKRVRASGMRHSWTPVFPDDQQILISMLPLEVTDTLTHVRLVEPGGLISCSTFNI